jgi:hypothetical protein
VEGSFLREYKRNWPDFSFRIMNESDAAGARGDARLAVRR